MFNAVAWVTFACSAVVYAAQGAAGERASQAPAPKAAQSSPPFPYRYGGRVERQGLPPLVALTRGSETYVVSAGDAIGTSYRLEHIGRDHIRVTYLPLALEQTIAFSSIAPDPPAAVAAPASAPAAKPTPTMLGTQAPACC